MTKFLSRPIPMLALAALPLFAACAGPAQDRAVAPAGPAISAEFPYQHKYVEVLGSKIAYVDMGEGDPILFIHGNPTSSYLWRNIMPYAEPYGRVIALDLTGMGKSDKPDIGYTFQDYARYLEGFIEALGLSDIALVMHDWGSALGMDYARRNERKIKGLVFMEAIVAPALPAPTYEAMAPADEFFRQVRTPGVGEEMILKNNMFVEVVLPEMGTVRDLTDAERAAYRAPYPTPESRKLTLVWPRQLPIAGEPAGTTKIVIDNGAWLKGTDLPKLYILCRAGRPQPAGRSGIFPEQSQEYREPVRGRALHPGRPPAYHRPRHRRLASPSRALT